MSTFRPERRPRSQLHRHGARQARAVIAEALRRGWVSQAAADQVLASVLAGRSTVSLDRGRLNVYGVLRLTRAEMRRVLLASRMGPDTFIRAELPEPREEDAG